MAIQSVLYYNSSDKERSFIIYSNVGEMRQRMVTVLHRFNVVYHREKECYYVALKDWDKLKAAMYAAVPNIVIEGGRIVASDTKDNSWRIIKNMRR